MGDSQFTQRGDNHNINDNGDYLEDFEDDKKWPSWQSW